MSALTAADRLTLLGPDGVAAARAIGAAAPPIPPHIATALALIVANATHLPADDLDPGEHDAA